MTANNHVIGEQFKHQNGDIFTVVEVNGEKYFENSDGDLFSYVEDDLILYVI